MHERALISREAAAFLGTLRGRPPAALVVALGPGVDPDVAEWAWREAARGTLAESAPVRWERASDLLRCLGCGREYRGDALTRCPGCGADGLVVEPAAGVSIHAIQAWEATG